VFRILFLLLCCQFGTWEAERARAAFAFAEAAEEQAEKKPAGDKCPDCYGTGKRGDGRTVLKCPTCKGTGKRTQSDLPPVSQEPAPAQGPYPEPEPAAIDPVPVVPVPIAEDVAPSAEPNPASDRDRLYGIRYTASWCQPCKVWEQNEDAFVEMEFRPVDIDTDAGRQQVERASIANIPAFFICDRKLGTVLFRSEKSESAKALNEATANAVVEIGERRRRNTERLEASVYRIDSKRTEGQKTITADGVAWVIESDADGSTLVTANHVVEKNSFHQVTGKSGVHNARVIISDQRTDLALVRVSLANLPALDVGTPDTADGLEVVVQANGQRITATCCPELKEGGNVWVLFDQIVEGGISGSPITFEGTAIGMVSFSGEKIGGTAGTRAAEIKALLNRTKAPKAKPKRQAEAGAVRDGGAVRDWIRARYNPSTPLSFTIDRRTAPMVHLVRDHGQRRDELNGLEQWELRALHDAIHKGDR
jgi:hypothetical protein